MVQEKLLKQPTKMRIQEAPATVIFYHLGQTKALPTVHIVGLVFLFKQDCKSLKYILSPNFSIQQVIAKKSYQLQLLSYSLYQTPIGKIPFPFFDPQMVIKILKILSKVTSDATASYHHSIFVIGSCFGVEKSKRNFAHRSCLQAIS